MPAVLLGMNVQDDLINSKFSLSLPHVLGKTEFKKEPS